MDRSLDDLTLRDKCREAQRVIRDLIDHLDQAFLPKVKNLRKLAKAKEPGYDPGAIRDVTIRAQAAGVLEAEQYTVKLDEESRQFLTALAAEVEHLANPESA